MAKLSGIVDEIVANKLNPKTLPDRRTMTVRLPIVTHEKLEVIQRLAGSSKTVAAEDILVSAVDEVWSGLLEKPELAEFFADDQFQDMLARQAEGEERFEQFAQGVAA